MQSDIADTDDAYIVSTKGYVDASISATKSYVDSKTPSILFTTRTAVASSDARAYCPIGYTRIACSGAREASLADTCKEQDCGYIGTLPYGSNGCRTTIDTA